MSLPAPELHLATTRKHRALGIEMGRIYQAIGVHANGLVCQKPRLRRRVFLRE